MIKGFVTFAAFLLYAGMRVKIQSVVVWCDVKDAVLKTLMYGIWNKRKKAAIYLKIKCTVVFKKIQ